MDCRISLLPKEKLRGGMGQSLPLIPTCAAGGQVPNVLQPWEQRGSVTVLRHSVSHLALCCGAHASAAASSAAGRGALGHIPVWKEVRWKERFIKERLD